MASLIAGKYSRYECIDDIITAIQKELPECPTRFAEVTFEYAGKTVAAVLITGKITPPAQFLKYVVVGTLARTAIRITCRAAGTFFEKTAPNIFNQSPSASTNVSIGCIASGFISAAESLSRVQSAINEALNLAVIFAADLGEQCSKYVHPYIGRFIASLGAEAVVLKLKY